MKTSILVIDSFSEDAEIIRKRVIDGELLNIVGPDGAKYTNVSRVPAPEFETKLAEAVGHKIEIKESGFRYDLKGEFPHNFAHADTICADYAALVYLNPDSEAKGGTAFWKHKPLALDHMPTGLSLEAETKLVNEWSDKSMWTMAGFVGMRFNRLLVYPTSMFHSRYPHEGFGEDRHNGRLVWVAFFSKK